MERLEEAILLYSESIQLNPTNPETYISRALVYTRLNRFNEAIDDFTKSISLNLVNSRPYFERAKCYMKLKQYDKSLLDFNKGVKLDPNNFEAYYFISTIELLNSNVKASLEAIERCLQINENFNYGIAQKIKVLITIGDIDKALETIEILKGIDEKLAKELF